MKILKIVQQLNCVDGDVVILDIRTHYIRFASAFCRIGDGPLLEEVLSIQTFVSPIFKDLPNDSFSVRFLSQSEDLINEFSQLVKEFLDSFLHGVLTKKDFSRKTKASFFNGFVLEQVNCISFFMDITFQFQISRLYNRPEVADYVHRFLFELCCGVDGLCSLQE